MRKIKRTPGRGGPLGPHADRKAGEPSGLARRIIRTRLSRSLSQGEAAAEVGVSLSAFSGWERGTEPAPLYRKALEEWLRRKGGHRE
jgi:DNA-binding XRE family transcriptional regulator